MAITVHKTTIVKAPLARAFAYVDDYRNIPEWLFGIESFQPAGAKDQGIGAIFDAKIHLGVTLKSTIECVEWEQDKIIAMKSIKGFKNTSFWRFSEVAAGTEIDGSIEYELPFGPAGKAMGKLIAPFVQMTVAKSSDNLAHRLDD